MESCCPSGSPDAGPRLRERPLGRCHTLDSGQLLEATHSADTSKYTPERDQTDEAHTPRKAGAETSGETDDTRPGVNETRSADVSAGSETSPSPPSDVHADNLSEAPPTHVLANHSASHGSQGPSDTDGRGLQPVNRTSEAPADGQTPVDAESSPSEGRDGNSNLTRPTELHFPHPD